MGIKLSKEQRLRLLYSAGDFQLALSASEFLSECDENKKYERIELRRFRCFETAMITAYCRPFSRTKGKIPSFNLNMIGMKLQADQKSLHTEVLALRNKVYAHSDEEMMLMRTQTFPVFEEAEKSVTFLSLQHDEGLRFIGLRLHKFQNLITEVMGRTVQLLFSKAQDSPDEFNVVLPPAKE